MAKLAIYLAIIGFAYWYWSGPYQESTRTTEADQLQENAATMQRCIRQEQRMEAAGGLAGLGGVGDSGVDAERLCAEKNNLHLLDGKWYSGRD
jgi:hypothetical protein